MCWSVRNERKHSEVRKAKIHVVVTARSSTDTMLPVQNYSSVNVGRRKEITKNKRGGKL